MSVPLLLVEDDPALQATLVRTLSRRGWMVTACGRGDEALVIWRKCQPSVVVLDLSLPGLDGLDLLAQARAAGLGAPVLVVTARSTVGDRIIGLNAGADDYLIKPFDLDELEARLRVLLRRFLPAQAQGPGVADVRVGLLRLDPLSGAVSGPGGVLELPPRELTMLVTLMHKAGRVVTKEQLFEVVFAGESDVQYEAVEVVVYRLRKKLGGLGVALTTLRGLGYLLKEVSA